MLLHHRSRSAAHPTFPRDATSYQPVGCPAVAGGLSLWDRSPVSHLRSGCQVWDGGSCCDSVDENQACLHFLREPLAELHCGALARELPPGHAGLRGCFERGPFTSIALRLCPLLPRRPNPSRTEKGNTDWQNSFAGLRSYHCSWATRRSASPLRPRGVNSPQFDQWHVLLTEISV
jgi:hypothetical protein